jgi:hypothetical protein
MPSKKQFIEIRSPRTEKLGRDSAVGGTVYADFVQDGQRVVLVKMPVAVKEVSMAKKKSHKKQATPAKMAATAVPPISVEKIGETTKDSPTSFDTNKMIDEVK